MTYQLKYVLQEKNHNELIDKQRPSFCSSQTDRQRPSLHVSQKGRRRPSLGTSQKTGRGLVCVPTENEVRGPVYTTVWPLGRCLILYTEYAVSTFQATLTGQLIFFFFIETEISWFISSHALLIVRSFSIPIVIL